MAVIRILRTLAVVVLASAGLVAPATAATASVIADVNDFSYAEWDAQYEVGLDDEGRARMHVTETLVARFPDFDQNRGIVRGLPTAYEGAGTDTRVLSVTDENGEPVAYETEEDDGVLYVLTGDDDYVRGLTTYVIEYEMRDIILSADTGSDSPGVDEFYWDMLPLDSTQDIEAFHADIAFDAEMSARLTGAARCYQGYSGSADECPIEGPRAEGDSAVFTVESGPRAAGDGVTVAIGFEPGTVEQPPARQPDPVTDVVPAIAAAGAFVLTAAGWLAVFAFQRRRRIATGIVVAQYDVPDSMPPLLAAAILRDAKDPIPAEIVHLAVRGTLRIEEAANGQQPRLRRLPGKPIPDPLDVEALSALFKGANAGGVVDLPKASEQFADRMRRLVTRGKATAAARGWTTRARSRAAVALQWCAIAVAVVGLALAIFGVASGRLTAVPALVAVSIVAILVLMSSAFTFSKHTVLTPDGAREHEYLQGVREFIRVAEEDRLRMLQSYSGAERRQDGSANVIVLYERLLPYAMLFGMEDEWGGVLESVYSYEEHGPGWIGDPNSWALRTHLSTFAASSHAAAAYSAPSASSSSSSGGSFGGGFSGGGGGGGFSGGR